MSGDGRKPWLELVRLARLLTRSPVVYAGVGWDDQMVAFAGAARRADPAAVAGRVASGLSIFEAFRDLARGFAIARPERRMAMTSALRALADLAEELLQERERAEATRRDAIMGEGEG